MPQQRTGKQTGMMVLGILKILGAATCLVFGVLLLTPGLRDAIMEGAAEGVAQSDPTAEEAEMAIGVLETGLVAITAVLVAAGFVGIGHGVAAMLASKPGASPTPAIVLAALSIVFGVGLFFLLGLFAIVPLGLNVARLVLAISVKNESLAMGYMAPPDVPYGVAVPYQYGTAMQPRDAGVTPQAWSVPPQSYYGQPQQSQQPPQAPVDYGGTPSAGPYDGGYGSYGG